MQRRMTAGQMNYFADITHIAYIAQITICNLRNMRNIRNLLILRCVALRRRLQQAVLYQIIWIMRLVDIDSQLKLSA